MLIKHTILIGYVFPNKLGFNEGITSWDLKNRIPRQKLPIWSYSQDPYARLLIVVNICRFYIKNGLKNSGLTLEFCLLVGIGRSGVMIGSLCLNMVTKFLQGSEL